MQGQAAVLTALGARTAKRKHPPGKAHCKATSKEERRNQTLLTITETGVEQWEQKKSALVRTS